MTSLLNSAHVHFITLQNCNFATLLSSPILYDPVLAIIVRSITSDEHGMVEVSGITLCVGVDAL